MGGQARERREVLQILAMACAAGTFPGFRRWSFACEHKQAASGMVDLKAGPYQPQFFEPEEYALVECLAEMIIPNDGTPGAREAGVSEFIDFMAASDSRIQERFRFGLAWLRAHAVMSFGKPFLELKSEQQTEILEHLAYKDRFRPGEEEGRAFFNLMRDYTMMGFYTSKIGLQLLDFPGLKTFWMEMPGCPHKDDPEHLHLPPPKL